MAFNCLTSIIYSVMPVKRSLLIDYSIYIDYSKHLNMF